MKTAEEWADAYWQGYNAGPNYPKFIEQIQLDAMKEGMRRAACLTRQNLNSLNVDSLARAVLADELLTATEQLTEKDL